MPVRLLAPASTTRSRFRWQTKLEGVVYGFRMSWNSRGAFWTLDIFSASGSTILRGLRVTTGVDLLAPFTTREFPPGQLYVVDSAGMSEPGRNSWRVSHNLVYKTKAEVDADALLFGSSSTTSAAQNGPMSRFTVL